MNKSTFVRIFVAAVAVALAFALGRVFAPSAAPVSPDPHAHAAAESTSETAWTCSMHPQVHQPEPGSCPICGMDLIPVTRDSGGALDEGELPRLKLSERSIALMNLQTAPVQRREARAHLSLPGRISVDETRRAIVSAWFSGRVERLYLDFVGARVKAGEHLVEMYSPQLFGAQEEFLQAVRASRGTGLDGVMVEAARSKLRLLGLSEEQIEMIRQKNAASTHLTYPSPVTGTVLERLVTAGQYVETGEPLYAIADLTHVWADLEADESDLKWLRYGQEVLIETNAYPGETFVGLVASIDPTVAERQRTTRVRVNLPNDERKLKPGMLATGRVTVSIGRNGAVLAERLAGKWISPMHPEIVKDAPGTCDICGMPLIPVEEMGYFAGSKSAVDDPLVIPASAPLITGDRSVVYVRVPDADQPTFEARSVVLGSRLDNAYLVKSGLSEGELVVTHGQFKIDSELQIRGLPSMMSPAVHGSEAHENTESEDPRDEPEDLEIASEIDAGFSQELQPLATAYLATVEGLANDDLSAAQAGVGQLLQSLETIGQHRLKGDAHGAWMQSHEALRSPAAAISTASSLEQSRAHLQELTIAMERIYANFGGGELPPVSRAFCPMLNGDQIGTWLQRGETIANPYFGSEMLRCGEVYGQLGNETSGK